MGLFDSLFGGGKKIDYNSVIPNPPQFQLAPGSNEQYLGGINQLIDVFNNRAQGNDIFDALKYIYEPQAQQLRQQYGIDTDPGDIFSQRSGSLPQTLASLNSRGLLDTGTSGVIEAQLRSNLNNELGRAFGSAKTLQRQDIDSALSNLHSLFPERFSAQNIPSQINYNNQLGDYNATLQRNLATANQQQQRSSNQAGLFGDIFGLAAAPFTGGASLAGLFSPSQNSGASGFGTSNINPSRQYNSQSNPFSGYFF